MDKTNIILEVNNLAVTFNTSSGNLYAVRDVSFDLKKGETLAIVGESGSGKSVTVKTILGINPGNARYDSGEVLYKGEDLLKLSEEDYNHIRGNEISMVFQDPLSSLDPIMKVGRQMTEAILCTHRVRVKKAKKDYAYIRKNLTKYMKLGGLTTYQLVPETLELAFTTAEKINDSDSRAFMHRLRTLCRIRDDEAVEDYTLLADQVIEFMLEKRREMRLVMNKDLAKELAIKMMAEVGIPEPEKRMEQFPHEFSGGMRQRVVIAIALLADPDLLICDEPTTALDVTIQAQILELIKKIKSESNIACLFITHDLGVVANVADKVAVMYAGKIVEYGTVEEIFYNARHPYTWALISSTPTLDSDERIESIPGTPPDMRFPPEGDAFADRNAYALEIDYEKQPPFFKISDTHYAATWLCHPDAPEVKPPAKVMALWKRYEELLKERGEAIE